MIFEPGGLPAISPFLSLGPRYTRFALANPIRIIRLPIEVTTVLGYMPLHIFEVSSIDFFFIEDCTEGAHNENNKNQADNQASVLGGL